MDLYSIAVIALCVVTEIVGITLPMYTMFRTTELLVTGSVLMDKSISEKSEICGNVNFSPCC